MKPWCFAPIADPAFVSHMVDVLDVYQRPYDPTPPGVCLDETSRQLPGETRAPLPVAPGQPARVDPESVRGGTAQLCVVTEPLRGARHVTVGAQRTRRAFAQCVQDLVDGHDPDAARIVLVMDQVHTHSPASLSATFPPAEAHRLAARLEIQHTPNHGSWLTMADPN